MAVGHLARVMLLAQLGPVRSSRYGHSSAGNAPARNCTGPKRRFLGTENLPVNNARARPGYGTGSWGRDLGYEDHGERRADILKPCSPPNWRAPWG